MKNKAKRSIAGVSAMLMAASMASYVPVSVIGMASPIIASAADEVTEGEATEEEVAAPLSILNDGYFYGKAELSEYGVTSLCVDATGTDLSYRWYYSYYGDEYYEVPADLDERYLYDVDTAVMKIDYNLIRHFDCAKFKCVVTDGEGNSVETKPLMLTKADANHGRIYISNGSIAYCVWYNGFDIREYFKSPGYTDYRWVNSTYNDNGWNFMTLYEDGTKSETAPEKFFFTFDENSIDTLIPHLVLDEGQVGFAMACDVYIDTNDYAAVSHFATDEYDQFQLIDSRSSFEYMGAHPEEFKDNLAMVIKTTMKPSEFYIGYYSDALRSHFRYNTALGQTGGQFDKEGHVVQVSGIDSGLSISWRDLEAGVEYVPFDPGLGSVENLGAAVCATTYLGNVLNDANGIVSIVENGENELEIGAKMLFKVNHTYTITSRESLDFGTFNGSVDLAMSEDGLWIYTVIPENITSIVITHVHNNDYKLSADKSKLFKCCVEELDPVTQTVAYVDPVDTVYSMDYEVTLKKGSGYEYDEDQYTVKYFDAEGVELADKPVNAGEYSAEVTYTVEGKEFKLVTPISIARRSILLCNAGVDPHFKVYDGQVTVPTITVGDGETILVEGQDYTVETTSGKDAGVYVFEITGIGNYIDGFNGRWEIGKADFDPIVVECAESKQYDGNPMDYTITSSLPEEAVLSVAYYKDNEYIGPEAPVKPGSYTLKITAESPNYNTAEVSVSFEIIAKKLVITPSSKEIVYGTAKFADNGLKLKYTTNGVAEEDAEFFANAAELLSVPGYDESMGAVGTYNIVLNEEYLATFENIDYYDIRLGSSATVTVKPININDPAIVIQFNEDYADGLVYNGTKQDITGYLTISYPGNVWGTDPMEDLDYRLIGHVQKTVTGEYAAQIDTVSRTLSGNYTGRKTMEWQIKKLDLPAAEEIGYEVDDSTYGDEYSYLIDIEKIAAIADCAVEDLTVEYTFTANDEAVETAPVNAGEYTVTASVSGEAYNVMEYTAEFTIAPKDIVVSLITEETTVTYGEADPEVPFTVELAEDSVLVGDDTIADLGIVSSIAPVGEYAEGSRPVGVYVYDGDVEFTNPNYNVELGMRVDSALVVDPKEITDDIFTVAEDVYYIDAAEDVADVTVIGKDGDKTLVYKTDFVLKGDVSAYEAGEYVVEVVGKGNYTGSTELSWKVESPYDEAKDAITAEISKAIGIDVAPDKSSDNKLIFVVNRIIPSGYNVVGSGIVCVQDECTDADALTIGALGSKTVGNNKNALVGTYKAALPDNGNGITARGYVTVEKDGYTVTVYTDLLYGNYEQLTDISEQQAQIVAEVSQTINITASANVATGKIKFVSNRMIPNGYTVLESGIVCALGESELSADEFIIGAAGVKKISNTKSALVSSYAALLPDSNKGITARGYVKVEKDGVSAYVYTDMIYADYAALKAEADAAVAAGIAEAAKQYMTIDSATTSDGKIKFTVERDLPDSYTVKKCGIVCVLGEAELTDEDFVIGADGVKLVAAETSELAGSYSAVLPNKNYDGVSARGYMQIVKDGITVDVYTDVLYANTIE